MKELRTVIFTREELERAISEHQQRSGTHFPPGSIKALAVEGPPPTITLTVPNALGGNRAVVISEKQLLSAVLEFCIAQRVPLPIRSAKRVEVLGDTVALIITMSGNKLSSEAPKDTQSALVYAAGTWTQADH